MPKLKLRLKFNLIHVQRNNRNHSNPKAHRAGGN